MASSRMVAIYAYAFIALAVCPVIFSAPAHPQGCAAPVCSGKSSSVLFEEGKTYIYNFETEVVTKVVGSSDDSNQIKVKGQAAVAAQSACDLILTIKQISISGSQPISKVNDIEGSSIRFGYNDGQIDNVCVSDDDPTWSANIKRAIVSMLGNRALNGESETIETDINGKCRTTHEHSGNKHTKTKDLNECEERDGGMTNAFGVPYSAPSKYHSVPLFNSILTCTQELGKGTIQNVDCKEVHSLEVVSTSGVRSDIHSTLTLANIQSGVDQGHPTNQKSCLLYDFDEHDTAQKQKSSAENANALLAKLCTEIESGSVSLKVPGLFLQLRRQVRHASKADLKKMNDQISSGALCPKAKNQLQKLLLDAAAMSSGDGAIGFLAEHIAAGEVQDTTKDLFIVYAAFAEFPGHQALEGVTTLISKADVPADYLLAASGLAHQYCKLSDPECASCEKYQNLVNTIAGNVKSSRDEEVIERTIVALQSLGNLDKLTPSAVNAIITLIEDSNTNERLKVRALDASRRDPCQETLKKKNAKIFSDMKESTHVRIQAYLTLSKCLTPEDVPAIQAVIDNDEESNQVGAFVVSHVANLIESASPGKIPQKKIFELIMLREFPSDIRKYSRNYEISAFDPVLMNSGLSLESNVIFSQDSYIPRCSNANFTVDAFGRSYNLMELGLCTQNFEDIFERLLGPTSKVRTVTLDDIVRESADKIQKLKTGLQNRFKRDLSENEIDAIRNEVDIHERTGDNANGDVYVRILGTSILAESFSRDGLQRQPLATRLLRAAEEMAKGVKEQNIDITEPFMFMDDEIMTPTVSGLPLTVSIEGTSVLSLQINGNLDMAKLFKGEDGDMGATVIPSAATVVKSRMTLGAGPIESGVQLEGKIHSGAGVDLKVVRQNRKFELRVNIPQERIQVFDIRSDVYWVEQTEDHLEKKTPVNPKVATKSIIDNQCSSSLTQYIGLKVCADIKAPQVTTSAPFFFLNGPGVVSLSIEKIEPSMEGYYLKVETINDQETYGLDLVLDTPGSATNRKITAQGRAIAPRSATPQYTLKIESPINNVELNYKRSFTDELKGVEVRVAVDGNAYTGVAEIRKTAEGSGYIIHPLVQYQLPQGQPVKLLEGEITRIPGQKLNVDLKTGGPVRALRGSVKGQALVTQQDTDNVNIEYKDLEFASEALGKVRLAGTYKRQGKLIDLKLDSSYGQDAQHTLTLDTTVGSPAPGEKVLKVTTRSSRRALLNFDLDWSLKKGDDKIEHKLKYTRGLEGPKVVVEHKAEIEIKSRREFDVESELEVKYPPLGIEFEAEVEAKSVPGKERHAKIEVSAGDKLKAKATYEATGEFLSNYKLLGNLVAGEKTYEVSEVATKVDANKRNYVTRLSVQPGFYYEAKTDVYVKREKGDFKTDLTTEVTSDQLEQPITLKTSVVAKKDGYGALLKLDASGKSYLDLSTSHQIKKEAGAPTSYATKMKAHILNHLDAKLTNTYSDGNGDLVLDALLVKSGRKIAGTSKLTKSGDTYDLKADLKWDADKDPSKAITLNSKTLLAFGELRLDSQNEITVIGKTAKLNLRGTLARDLLNGESTGEVDYTSPNGKTHSIASKIELENKRNARGVRVTMKVTPAEVAPSEIEIGVRGSNLDEQEGTFDIKADLKASYRQQKDLKLHGELSSALPGNYRSYAASLSASGSALPKPLDISGKADYKSGKIALIGKSVNPVESSVDATIEYDTWSPKKTVGITYEIITPVDRIKTLKGELAAGYLFNSIRNFELSHQISIALNGGSPYSSTYLLSVLEKEAKYNHKLVSDGKEVVTVTGDGKFDSSHIHATINSDVRGKTSKLNLDIEHGQLPNIVVKLNGETQLVPGVSNFELELSNHKGEDGSLETRILASSDGEERLRILNKLANTPTRKGIDLSVAVGDEPARKLVLQFQEEQKGKWNVEAFARWGEGGKFIDSKGTLNTLDGNIIGELQLDSPHFNANKFSVRVAKSLKEGQHGIDITVDGNNQRQVAVALTYGKRSVSDYERAFEGTLKVEGRIDFNGNFKLDDTTLDKQRDNGEEGRRIRANLELSSNNNPVKLNFLAKRSNKENRVQLSYCKDGEGECKIGKIQFKHDHAENGDLDYELRAVAETTAGGANQETNGIVIQSRLQRATKKFEHIVRLIISSEKDEQVGYRLYSDPEHREIGGEILLPQRKIALVGTGERTASGAYNSEIAFYIDKTKNAARKVSLLLTVGEKAENGDHARGRTVSAIFRHPDLGKDLSVKTRYAYGGDNTIIELETVLDVLQAGNEIIASYSVSRQTVADGKAYNGAFAVVSKGLHINLEAKSELKYAGRELSYQNVITYENRNSEKRTSQILLGVSRRRFNFEIDGPDTKLVSLISAYEATPTGGEIRYEIHLPGMEDTRIIRAIATTVSPRSVQLKTSASSSPQLYLEAFLGFRSDDELAAGIYDHQADGRHVLADVNFALNGTRILSVRSDWNKENAQKVLERAEQRAGKHASNLQKMISDAVEEIFQELKRVSSNIRSAAPDLGPVVQGAKQQLTELKQELEANEDTKMILMRLRMGGAYLRHFTRVVLELARTARRMALAYIGGLRESLNELPNKYNQILEKIPEYIEKLRKFCDDVSEAVNKAAKMTVKILIESGEKIYENLPPFAEVWNWLVDHTEEIVELAARVAQKVAENLATVYKGMRDLADELLKNRTLQTLLSELKVRLLNLLAEFVEETKEQLDSLKNYVLSTVPQKEFQEFVEALADYIQKKASKIAVDDSVALKDIFEKLRATISRALSDVLTLDFGKGILRAKIPLPMSLSKLSELSKLLVMPSVPKISMRVPAYTYGVREFINQIRSGAAINELVPPFKGYALLIGSKHYRTFDGRHFEFEGSCRYLLASDFDDANFTVVADYARQGDTSEKTIIVTDGDATVALKPDHSVVVNGQPVELDTHKEAGTLLIERIGDYTLVRSSKGAIVGCSNREDVCALKVDGFYHGKVLGLLGTMNQEFYDDLRMPNGDIAQGVGPFAASWKLNKQCAEPMVNSIMLQATASAQEKCRTALDNRRSSLRPCYGVVDPTPFRNVCEKLSQKPGYTEEKAVCTASIGYAKACYMSYAKVDPVPACSAA